MKNIYHFLGVSLIFLQLSACDCRASESSLYDFQAQIQADRTNEWICGRFSIDSDSPELLTFSVNYAMPRIKGLKKLGLENLLFQINGKSVLIIKPLDNIYAQCDLTVQNFENNLLERYRWLLDFIDLIKVETNQRRLLKKQVYVKETSSIVKGRSVFLHLPNMKVAVHVCKSDNQAPIEIPNLLESSDEILELLRKKSNITNKDVEKLERVLLTRIEEGTEFTLDPIRAGYGLLNLALIDSDSEQLSSVYETFQTRIDSMPTILRQKFREDLFLYLIAPPSSVPKVMESKFRNQVLSDYKKWACSLFGDEAIDHYVNRISLSGYPGVASYLKPQEPLTENCLSQVAPETLESALMEIFEKYTSPNEGNDPSLAKELAVKYRKQLLSFGYNKTSALQGIVSSLKELLDRYDTLIRPISSVDLQRLDGLFTGLTSTPLSNTHPMTEQDIGNLMLRLKNASAQAMKTDSFQKDINQVWEAVESAIRMIHNNYCLPACKRSISEEQIKHLENEISKYLDRFPECFKTSRRTSFVFYVVRMLYDASINIAYDSVLTSYASKLIITGPHIVVDPFDIKFAIKAREQ